MEDKIGIDKTKQAAKEAAGKEKKEDLAGKAKTKSEDKKINEGAWVQRLINLSRKEKRAKRQLEGSLAAVRYFTPM